MITTLFLIVVVILVIFGIYSNKIEGFSLFSYTEPTGPKDYQFAKYQTYTDTVYETGIKKVFENNPKMICNILPTIADDKCVDNTNNLVKRQRFPVHIIKLVDGKYLAVFNNGRIYSKMDINDRFWKGPLKNSIINNNIPLRMITIDAKGTLLGVGYDNRLYRKVGTEIEDEKYETLWEYIPNNENIIYVMYQTADRENTEGDEKDVLIAINTDGYLMKKNYNKIASDKYTELQNDKFPVVKIYMDRNGFMLGIGADMKLYKKEQIDWERSVFDMVTGGNKSLTNDIIYDNDAKFYGLVFVPSMGVLELMKQKMSFYLSEFIPLEFISKESKNANILNDLEIVKLKSGVDYPTLFSVSEDYGDKNLIEAQERIEMMDRKKLREFCAKKGYTGASQYHNFELLTQMEEQQKKIENLNGVIQDMIKYDPDKHRIQEIEIM